MPVTRENAAFVRLMNPDSFTLFYNADDPINPWVAKGYTRWSIADWEGKFGKGVDCGQDDRKWDFFGFSIPLYDDHKT